MINFIIFIFIIFNLGCNNSTKVVRDFNYYPGEYRPELNIGNTTIINSEDSVKSNYSMNIFIILKDTKDNFVKVGGTSIKLSQKSGSGSFKSGSIVDNSNGTYSLNIIGEKVGDVEICLLVNGKQLNVCKKINILVGDLSLSSSDIFISRTHFLIGDSANVSLTLKDSYGNIIDNNSLSLYPTIIGTSQGTLSNFVYQNKKYQAILTATQEGTESELNISILGLGIVKSKYIINVSSSVPNYTNSTLSSSKIKIKIGESVSVVLSLKDLSGNLINEENVPITFEAYDGTSVIEFGEVLKNGSSYVSTIKGINSGSVIKIKAKINGEFINQNKEISMQVVP